MIKSSEELDRYMDECVVVAQQVIDGSWGNGFARRESLSLAGYDYYHIQTIVNKLIEDKLHGN